MENKIENKRQEEIGLEQNLLSFSFIPLKNEAEKFQEIISTDLKSMQNLMGFYKILAKTNRRITKEQELKK